MDYKLKYVLGVYKDLPEFPTPEDIYWAAWNSVQTEGKAIDRGFTLKWFHYIFGPGINETQKFKESFQEVLANGWAEPIDGKESETWDKVLYKFNKTY